MTILDRYIMPRRYAVDHAWRAPTADSVGFRLVQVARGEMTCTRCCEVTATDYCVRCGSRSLIPTLTYLHEGEYREL